MVEINQVCAVETGSFVGDRSGFPVVITGVAGNSYRLKSDLAVGVGNVDTDGLFINTSGVTIDCNGFTLVGPSLGTGTSIAIHVDTGSGSTLSCATFSHGSIRGWRGRDRDPRSGRRAHRAHDLRVQ